MLGIFFATQPSYVLADPPKSTALWVSWGVFDHQMDQELLPIRQPRQIELWYLVFTSGLLLCRPGRSVNTRLIADGCDNGSPNACRAAAGESNTDGWSRASPPSLKWCADESRNVNKQLKCQHSGVSEALAALAFTLQQKRDPLPHNKLNLASKAFLWLRWGATLQTVFATLCYCRCNQFYSM